jgi:predicted N-formylglutamate amidohydrolase
MKNYMIIAKVKGVDYLTNVEAESEYNAEHKILDLGICGKHDYSVECCMAYDYDAMSTETFRSHALNADPISFDALNVKIEVRNAEIRQRDYAEKRITEIENKIERLKAELEENKKLIEK